MRSHPTRGTRRGKKERREADKRDQAELQAALNLRQNGHRGNMNNGSSSSQEDSLGHRRRSGA
jgi:hypothetical protein